MLLKMPSGFKVKIKFLAEAINLSSIEGVFAFDIVTELGDDWWSVDRQLDWLIDWRLLLMPIKTNDRFIVYYER